MMQVLSAAKRPRNVAGDASPRIESDSESKSRASGDRNTSSRFASIAATRLDVFLRYLVRGLASPATCRRPSGAKTPRF